MGELFRSAAFSNNARQDQSSHKTTIVAESAPVGNNGSALRVSEIYASSTSCSHPKSSVVSSSVIPRIGGCQEDQARCSNDGKDRGENRQNLLALTSIVREASLVAEPALGYESQVEDDDRDCRSSNEQRLDTRRANVTGFRATE